MQRGGDGRRLAREEEGEMVYRRLIREVTRERGKEVAGENERQGRGGEKEVVKGVKERSVREEAREREGN